MLEMFFAPRSVAVIGASREPGKLGYGVLSNIITHGYEGKVYPINPKADEILGLKCYASVLDVPDPIDLAIIVVPAKYVIGALEECGQKGVRGAVIISAGFREVGAEGRQREKELVHVAQQYGIRLVGPNVLGIIDTVSKLNASFAVGMPRRGKIAFMSQSGALCTSILDIALAQDIGFSRFVSLGNKADLNEIDFIEEWWHDPESNVIMAYLEGIVDGERFMRITRQVTKEKPIIAIKSGTTSAGSRAVSSHTGTLAGSEKAYDAAFRQVGVLRANSVQELFDYSVAFARQPLLKSERIAIVTNAGGPGIMATDACERYGLQLASLKQETMEYLRANLPAAASVINPVDVLGDALADRYKLAIEAVLQDEGVGGVVVVLTPQVMTQIEETAQVVGELSGKYDKPIFGAFMGEATTSKGVRILNQHQVPNYPVPERAVAAMGAMLRYREWLQRPPLQVETFDIDRDAIRQVFEQVKADGRLQIGDAEARTVLRACGVRVPASELATNIDEAVEIADRIGYPVVMKIASPDILHKSDIGGVKLGIRNPTEVRDAFDLITYRATRYMPDAQIWGCQIQEMVTGGREVIIGMNRDLQFGPLMMFGLGGIYVEALKDVTFRVAPFSRQEAKEMINEIRSIQLLRGVRGEPPADMEAIVDVLLRMSQLVTEFPEIVEFDINPLIVYETGRGVVGVDMRLVLS
ncbi:MAG: acetate--CoA ligase [Anaerolineae bacterium]|jgi:acetyltransferase|nr:acetate--CoA ligase [Anaerolineae bacterium]MDH7474748.1 acetate--CoA ligase [Anaerolineae bacterium]